VGPLLPEPEQRVLEVARAAGAHILRPGTDYPSASIAPALGGAHQLANAALAVAISRRAADALARPIADHDVRRGLRDVRWPGRLERIGDVLFDCAHNVEGTQALVTALPEAPRRVLVASIVRDKNAAAMLSLLGPHFDLVVATKSPSERAIKPERLAELVCRTRSEGAARCGGSVDVRSAREVRVIASPAEALASARAFAGEVGGLVVVAGSIFLVGVLRAALLGQGGQDPAIEVSDPLP
jgi:dihydrofolate synthase/folylpolyglutamate synthase